MAEPAGTSAGATSVVSASDGTSPQDPRPSEPQKEGWQHEKNLDWLRVPGLSQKGPKFQPLPAYLL